MSRHLVSKISARVSIMTPILLTDKSKLQEIYDLRIIAYKYSTKAKYVNKEIFPNGWKDHLDEINKTVHWIVADSGKIIAAARLSILDNTEQTGENFNKFILPSERPFAYWSRLVIHPNYRYSNIMMKLDHVRKNFIQENEEIAFAICCATSERHNAILRLGFINIGNFAYNWGG